MYQPGKGQTMQVANVRLNLNGPEPKEFSRRSSPHSVDGYSVPNALEYQRTKILPKFKVLGTDQEVIDIRDLGKSYNDKWTKPNPKTIDEVQAEFKDQFQKIQNDHPKAVMAILREEDKGFDPANPDKLYAGWKIAHISCHGPDGPNPGREKAASGSTVEAFMRHRDRSQSGLYPEECEDPGGAVCRHPRGQQQPETAGKAEHVRGRAMQSNLGREVRQLLLLRAAQTVEGRERNLFRARR
jgi:hypothetical protein